MNASLSSSLFRPRGVSPARRVMTHEEALAFAKEVLDILKYPHFGVKVDHRVTTILSISQTKRFKSMTFDSVTLSFGTTLGMGIDIDIDMNLRDRDMLRRAITLAQLKSMPHSAPPPNDEDSPNTDDPWERTLGPQQYLPVTLWHQTTHDAMDGSCADALCVIGQQLAAAKLIGTGTLALNSRAYLTLLRQGRSAWGESTDSELTVTARTPDGTGSGWSGQAHRDWTQLHPDRIAQEAIDLAQRSQHPIRVEPGKYTAILSANAVGTLVETMTRNNWFHIQRAPYPDSPPFVYTDVVPGRPPCKLGQRVFDPRITLSSDPSDPECGDFPFFDDGRPSGRETWVKDGVLRAMAYNPGDGIGKVPIKDPQNVRMSGSTTSIEQMIATCERGIYVNRLSGVMVADRPSGTMSGVTRDGCFLIKNGKIDKPVINFRIYQSPVLSFNNVLAMGEPKRVSFGFSPPPGGAGGRFDEALGAWPKPPVIAPPMMVHDFNFSALADAI